MSSTISVEASHQFAAPAQSVYDAWLTPESVRSWLPTSLRSMGLSGEVAQVEINAKVGGSFVWSDIRDQTETKHWGQYVELDSPHKIVFTWNTVESDESDPVKVSMILKDSPDGCLATLVTEMDSKWSQYVEQARQGWMAMLKATDSFLSE